MPFYAALRPTRPWFGDCCGEGAEGQQDTTRQRHTQSDAWLGAGDDVLLYLGAGQQSADV